MNIQIQTTGITTTKEALYFLVHFAKLQGLDRAQLEDKLNQKPRFNIYTLYRRKNIYFEELSVIAEALDLCTYIVFSEKNQIISSGLNTTKKALSFFTKYAKSKSYTHAELESKLNEKPNYIRNLFRRTDLYFDELAAIAGALSLSTTITFSSIKTMQ